jgi:hypothetical protein
MARILTLILLFLCILSSQESQAKVHLPKNLSSEDRVKVLEILGPGTSGKILTDPYPLGGFAGFEAGIEIDAVPISDISNLGDTVPKQELFNYPIITIGKGVYKNVDIFVHFIPSSEGTGISEYGGIVRYGFYQMAYLPVSFALNLSASSANINNQLITKNFSYDFTAGITTQNIYFYGGAGQLQSGGEFSGGGADGITDSGQMEQHKVNSPHYFVGVGFRVESIFLTGQMDYHEQPTFAMKLGFRY